MVKRARGAKPSFTVSADLIRGLVDCAVACGLPRSRFADLLARDGGRAPLSRTSGERVLKFWERVQRLSGDPILGFRMARFASGKTFGALGEILPRCATVFDAYTQMARYSALASRAAHISVARDASLLSVALDVDLPAGSIRSSVLLWGLTNASLLPQRLTGLPIRPASIACAFPSPGASAARTLEEYCPHVFGAGRNRIVFKRGVGDLAVPTADADLQELLAEVIERHLAELGSARSFEQGLLAILREMLNGTMPTLASLSAHVAMSQRTLQRRLTDAKTSFQTLLQQVLRQEAGELLAGGKLTQGEIAFLLGYSEVSAFSRAYRRWTGHPPGAARAGK